MRVKWRGASWGLGVLLAAATASAVPPPPPAPPPTVWSYPVPLQRPDAGLAPSFGSAVALTDHLAIVGASDAEVGGVPQRGAVYAFAEAALQWKPQAVLAPDTAGEDFGYAVSLWSDTLIVGAPAAGGGQGAAYVFVRSGSTWSRQGPALVATDGSAGARFGSSVSVSGDTAVVGAPVTAVDSTHRGAAYVFVRTGTTWQQQGAALIDPIDSGGALSDFGTAVAVSGDLALVGAPRPEGEGSHAILYQRTGALWALQQDLVQPSGGAAPDFGAAVALSGVGVVVGSPTASMGLSAAGAIQIGLGPFFGMSGSATGAEFGRAISASDDGWLAVGAPGTLIAGRKRGDLFLLRAYAGQYLNFGGGVQPLSGVSQDLGFGRAVAARGPVVLVGSRGDGTSSGAAYIMTACATPGVCCLGEADCDESSFCSREGLCAPRVALGGACEDACLASPCLVCGDQAECQLGECRPANLIFGAACAADSQCATGHCTDGVCCLSACGQPCQACAEPGSEGRCVAVTGSPRSARIQCDPGTDDCTFACNGRRVDGCVTTCAGKCASDNDCAAEFQCASGQCRKVVNGTSGAGGASGGTSVAMGGADLGGQSSGSDAAGVGNGAGSAGAPISDNAVSSACGCRLSARPAIGAKLWLALSLLGLSLRRKRRYYGINR